MILCIYDNPKNLDDLRQDLKKPSATILHGLKELETTRKHSRASNSTAWRDFTTEMYRKTVLHRLCKHIELDFETLEQQNLYRSEYEIENSVDKEDVPEVFVDCEVIE